MKVGYLCSYLPHGVTVPQGGGVWGLVDCVEVDGDAESHADLIGPGIASPDGPGGIVHFVRHAIPGQGFRYPKHKRKITNGKQRSPQCHLHAFVPV